MSCIMNVPWVLALLLLGSLALAEGLWPFATCAHPGRFSPEDYSQDAELIARCGLKWVRCDWSWGYFEPANDEWQWEIYDRVVEAHTAHGVGFLPILCYSSPWAGNAQYALEEWADYVKHVVERYGDRFKYWEVWNEPNLSFWKPEPNAQEYLDLLKVTYRTVKATRPDCQVIGGAFAWVPLDFIEQLYQLGWRDYFDILSCHPYRYPGTPEGTDLMGEMQRLHELMARYGDKDKPVWITELGWPTHTGWLLTNLRPQFLAQLCWSAKRVVGQSDALRVAVFAEEGFPGCSAQRTQTAVALCEELGWQVAVIDRQGLGAVSWPDMQVVVMTQTEPFPQDQFPALLEFVEQGGLLVCTEGVPFYYTTHQQSDGTWKTEHSDESWRQALHIQFHCWWTREGTPEHASQLRLPALEGQQEQQDYNAGSTLYLNEANCSAGDKFIPLAMAREDDKDAGAVIALYDLNSNLAGGVLVSTLPLGSTGVSEDEQARLLPRAYLLSLAAGVEVVFWYDFRDDGDDSSYYEHRCGIVRHDHTPKPAWLACKTMTETIGALPFVKLERPQGDLYVAVFGDEEKAVWAVWTTGEACEMTLCARGTDTVLVSSEGLRTPMGTCTGRLVVPASQSVVYVTGLSP